MMIINSYVYILKFLYLGFIIIKNCVVMGFMYMGLEDCFYNYLKLVVYFGECVKGGVGLIIIGGIFLNC